ncbi:MAG: chorismate synthase [Candidatus Omnitrophota bacterium]|jgi:chorismate synthase|nr:MAG: chorismate synthase [Candidatus Omnitrophota bacterium]
MGSIFGRVFRISTWGESHGGAVGVVVDGCPPGIEISEAEIQCELDRRRPGQSKITSQRRETDAIQILSGVFEGKTLGTPISMMVWNQDARSQDYSEIQNVYRPSHADYTYDVKYGFRDFRGGGRSSARETIGRVAAGAIAAKFLKLRCNMEIVAYVKQIYNLVGEVDPKKVRKAQVEKNIVRCPDQETAAKMIELIDHTRKAGDSVGGVIECVVRNVPPGLGEPVFDRLEADLAKAMLSLPATKGFEIGSGFSGVTMTGSEHNDSFYSAKGRIRTKTNRSGGVQGGISNGEDLFFRVAFKPTATILRPQKTVTPDRKSAILKPKGRHDPCVLPRAVPIVEAMAALVLVDHYLLQGMMRSDSE